ncbi:hypothetical protein [Stenoxybacter acetivorans]|uniref:hypothetical protein n=1 Tax=Stenoxybacter acetivorans TaxID=422441 RepID=UPI00056922BC|nr:hypothetical protein [Stenoxybacter acetivorans]
MEATFGLCGVVALINPFLGVNHAWMSAPAFPLYSHVGFPAVSYLFLDSETGIHNRDNMVVCLIFIPAADLQLN